MSQSKPTAPTQQSVPAAKISFAREDRRWISERIEEVLESGQLTLGRYGEQFEKGFAALCGVPHGVAVNSGTAALEIVLRTLGVENRDVLVPANTFFATAAAVVHAGGRPVLMDTDPETLGTAPEEIERRITPDTAGLIVVHIGGTVSPRMKELQEAASRRGLWLVEDAAHAHGSSYAGTAAGAFGIAAAFSFYPTKVMTSAEGGMIVTSDERIAEEARIYRDQGKASFALNAHTRLGYNWRLSEPHAIIGVKALERLPESIQERQRLAALYDEALEDIPSVTPLRPGPDSLSNYYKYIAMLPAGVDRGALKTRLKQDYSVSLSGEVYEAPLQRQPIFQRFSADPLPISEDVCARHICLPLFPGMSESQLTQVVEALKVSTP
jgi:perosamine synthetase